MLYKLTTDFPKFKPIFFNSGINIILAKREKNTANGVGKTLCLACIDYVLGAEYKKSILSDYPELNGITVSLTMDYFQKKVVASRKIGKTESKNIYLNDLETDKKDKLTVSEWNNKLVIDKFSVHEKKPELSWRKLLRLFIKNQSVKDFSSGLKSFEADNLQKVSLYQSYLLNIAFDEVLNNYFSSELTAAAPKLTEYVKKVKSVVDKSSILEPADVDNYSEFQRKISDDIQKERADLIYYQENIDVLSLRFSKLSDSLQYIDKAVGDGYFKDLYTVFQSELADFVKKGFKEALAFHNDLTVENQQAIYDEMATVRVNLDDFKKQKNNSQSRLKKLLQLKAEKTNELPNVTSMDMVINEFLSKPNNQISNEINKRVNTITNKNVQEIQEKINESSEFIDQCRNLLDKYVTNVYHENKNLLFNIEYEKSFKINFSYDEDSGTGKSNMKLLFYYYFLLIINHTQFDRNMDMMFIDTDFTDGIDSTNLFSFFYTVSEELLQQNCQVIVTLKDDMGVTTEEIIDSGWVSVVLSDTPEGYLFKEKLKKLKK